MPLTSMTVSSPDIGHESYIDDRFAGREPAETPRFEVGGIPEGTAELALICDDPDAPMPGGFIHWTLYGLPARIGHVDPTEGRHGPNDAETEGYAGPYPPAGHGPHHYFFWVYALSRPVEGEPTRDEFLRDYADAVVGQARVVGLYRNA